MGQGRNLVIEGTHLAAGARRGPSSEATLSKMTRNGCASLVFIACALFCVGGNAFAQASLQSGGSKAHIEMTEADLFGRRIWNSRQVSIMGFYLGMPRVQAFRNARQNGFALFANDPTTSAKCEGSKCVVCDPKGSICPGLSLDFDRNNRIYKMAVDRIPEDASEVVQASAITRHFKGRTYQFFYHYSEALRLQVLGPGVLVESHTSRPPPPRISLRDETYSYPERGLKVYASLVVGLAGKPDEDIDLTVSFSFPLAGVTSRAPATMTDPLFGISYVPRIVKFEEVPRKVMRACPGIHDEKAWTYGHLNTPAVEYFIVSGLTRVCSDGSGPCGLSPDDVGTFVALRGSKCSTEAVDSFYWRKDHSIWNRSGSELNALAHDALRRYSKAFGGKRQFLAKVQHREFLAPGLKKQLEIFENSQNREH